MPTPYIGEIRIFAGNFAPSGWTLCDGRLLSVQTDQNLFALIGTTYGGDGITSFAVPDFRGRAPLGPGQGPELPDYAPGQAGGAERVTLTLEQLPAHTHTLRTSAANGSADSPAQRIPARDPAATPAYAATPDSALAAAAVGPAGDGQSHDNMQPYIALHYIIARSGIYPTP